ncbi:hypothetical protein BDW22DRAFT_1361210 [Trametopsis cervina]|nr:hypothetical protein BDW22DRAFT_1361210 [Trametopsis cervina]
MSDSAPSPEKSNGGKPPRTTYAGRMKKKRRERRKEQSPPEVVEDSEKEGEEEGAREGEEESEEENTMVNESKPQPSNHSTSPPVSKRSVAEATFVVPATSVKVSHKPPSTASSVTSISAGSNMHARSGSVSSAKAKPPSIVERESPASVSDTESTVDGKQRRKRKTEAERIQFLKDDPWCKELEPHRILCNHCGEWQELHPKRKYVMQAWINHRKACPGPPKSPTPAPSKPPSQVSTPLMQPTPLRMQPSMSNISDTLSPMEAEGKATLERDARAGEIRPHEVFCTQCASWVKLYPSTKYSTRNWLTHMQQCPGQEPVAASAEPEEAATTIADAPSSATVPSTPRASEKAPIDSAASPSLLRKRGRDDSEVDEQTSTPKRHVRARTDSYKTPRGQALWSAITKPISSFIQGFKHGLRPEREQHAESSVTQNSPKQET